MPRSDNGDDRSTNEYAEFMKATNKGNAEAIQRLITQAKSKGHLDENTLRLALQSAARKGSEAAARVLLENGARTDLAGKKGSPALFWAVSQPQTKGHIQIINLLLDSQYAHCPADMEWADEKGQTILMSAALRGHKEALAILLKNGAKVNARDRDGRTVMHNLAADKPVPEKKAPEKPGADDKSAPGKTASDDKAPDKGPGDKKVVEKKMKWDREIVTMLLDMPINLDIRDKPPKTRSPLHWAAATGNRDLVEQLLTRRKYRKPNINLTTNRGKTALHLACDAVPADLEIVQLLLNHGANPALTSDGGWTCLHNSASVQNSVEVCKLLLESAPSLINAQTSPGLTALHFAAQAGFLSVVDYLLSIPETKLNPKDTFYSTPLLRAAQFGHHHVVDRLAPFNNTNRLSHYALSACNAFEATIVDFRSGGEHVHVVDKRSVFEVLYGRVESGETMDHTVPTLVENIKTKGKSGAKQAEKENSRPRFRWIHLPANNLAWVEALIAKHFIESGAVDFDGFRALEKGFSQQHRGPKVHSHFMRPLCQRSARDTDSAEKLHNYNPLESALKESASQIPGSRDIASSPERAGRKRYPGPWGRAGYPGLSPSRAFPTVNERSEEGYGDPGTPPMSGYLDVNMGRTTDSPGPNTPEQSGTGEGNSPNPNADISSKRGKRNRGGRRRSGQPNADGGPTGEFALPSRKASFAIEDHSLKATAPNNGAAQHNGSNISFFMPYLHFETDERRRKMTEAVNNAQIIDESSTAINKLRPRSDDETLIWAHLSSSTGLHLRRTLDQFYLHGIDTEERDADQVVGRYFRDKGKEEKIFMVDQLWMWILGPGLIVTSFPQRWQQPKNDPLNVLDGIIEDLHSKTGNRVQSVYDLSVLITARCCGPFDRHKPGDEDYQFLDMFESSIGNVNNKETALYKDFYDASAQVHNWLSNDRSTARRLSKYMQKTRDHYPDVVDNFINIGKETKLLQEIKDIREEIKMISMVLHQQKVTLPSLAEAVNEDLTKSHFHSRGRECKRKIEEQKRFLDVHLNELDRMGSQTASVETSLVHLLDLKQKQSNALEARFARDQAAGTVKQGQIIMTFTMVTIIFLPLSFMAAFFAINIKEFPHDANGNQQLHLGFVIKYTVGIGLGISLLLIAVAFSLSWLRALTQEAQDYWTEWRRVKNAKLESSTTRNSSKAAQIYGLTEVSASGRKSAETDKSFVIDTLLSRTYTGQSELSPDLTRRVRYSQDLERGRGS